MNSQIQEVLTHWVGRLIADQSIADRIAESFALSLEGEDGAVEWQINLCEEGLALSQRAPGEHSPAPGVRFTLTESDFISIADGELNPQLAYQSGRLRVEGNVESALKISSLFTPHLMSTSVLN